jgi:hypothetical protein
MVANGGDNAAVSASISITDEKKTNVTVFPSPQVSLHQVMITKLVWQKRTGTTKKQTRTWHTTFKSLEVGSNGDSEYNVPQASR